MFQVAQAILLSVSLLACPMYCWGAFDGSGSEIAAASHCACCQTPATPASESPAPDQHDDCGCESCACEGALLPDVASVDLDDGPEAAWGWDGMGRNLSTEVGAAVSREFHDPLVACGTGGTGRSVRIAHQSFLI